jgi:hypothetical protein
MAFDLLVIPTGRINARVVEAGNLLSFEKEGRLRSFYRQE